MSQINPHLSNWRYAWNLYFGFANGSFHEFQSQQRTKLLFLLLTILWPGMLILLPLWAHLNPTMPGLPFIAMAHLGVLVGTHFLLYTGHDRAAAALLSLLFPLAMGVILLTPIVSVADRLIAFNVFMTGILLTSLLLSVRDTLMITGIGLFLFALFLWEAHYPLYFVYSFIGLIFFTSFLIIAATFTRHYFLYHLVESEARHRQMSRELRQSQQHLDAFFNQLLAGTFFMMLDEPVFWNESVDKEAVLDYVFRHQRVTRVNEACLAQCQKTREQLLKVTPQEMFAHDLAAGRDIWRQLFDTGRLHLETIMHRLDGQPIWLEGDYVCLYDDRGRITGHCGVQRDITQRKEREQQLRRSEARYRSLFEQTHDAVFVLDLQGRHLQANQRAAELLGYTVAEIQTLTTNDLSAEQEASRMVRERLLQGEPVPMYERLFRQKDGTVIPVEVTVELVRDEDGRPLHIQSVVRDIRQRKQLEMTLRQSEARLRSILDSMHEIIWSAMPNMTELLYLNPVVAQITGHPAEAFYADTRLWLKMMHPEDRHMLRPVNQQLQQSGVATWESRIIRPDGQTRTLANRMELIRDEQGRPLRIDGLSTDITDRKQAAAQTLALALEQERGRILSLFMQNASHEFRTPLATISLYLFLTTEAAEKENRVQYAQLAEKQITRLTHLLEMLLLMSTLDSQATLQVVPIDLNRLVDQTVDAALYMAPGKLPNIKFHLTSLPIILGDETYLAEAVRQLLDNALRYTPEEGEIYIQTAVENQGVVIEIRDTGAGIEATALPYIFERFWRQDVAHTTAGFGLGLPIVQQIVTRHGGSITVDSIPGEGSTFRIWLPQAFEPAKSP